LNADEIQDLFSSFGPVRVRRMFGGAGIYAEAGMFALVADGELYFKADAVTEPSFVEEGSGPFVYEAGGGRRTVMSYWRVPERLLDDPEELAAWARQACGAAERAAGKAARRKRP